MRNTILLSVALFLLTGFAMFSIRFQHFVQSGISMLAASGGVLLTVTVGAPSSGGGGGSSSNGGNNGNNSGGGGGGGGSVGGTLAVATAQKVACSVTGDINGDGRVNLIDFSILAYWYKRTLTPSAKVTVDLNHDGKVTLVDFSILAFYWNKTICATH